MNNVPQLGKVLILIGLFIIAIGGIFLLAGKVKWLGHLPGDIYIKKDNFSFYFPITTCILISLIFSFIFWIFSKR